MHCWYIYIIYYISDDGAARSYYCRTNATQFHWISLEAADRAEPPSSDLSGCITSRKCQFPIFTDTPHSDGPLPVTTGATPKKQQKLYCSRGVMLCYDMLLVPISNLPVWKWPVGKQLFLRHCAGRILILKGCPSTKDQIIESGRKENVLQICTKIVTFKWYTVSKAMFVKTSLRK